MWKGLDDPPPMVKINDTLLFTAFINPVAGDEIPANDTAILKQKVIGPHDPNDKTESNEGSVPTSFVTKGSNRPYLIRYRNTGTDIAFNITVRDTLSARVNAASLQMVAAGHPYTPTIENSSNLTCQFKNILLPDHNVNKRASQGFILYTWPGS
ncbi:MAG TPA: hypothetical protein VM884_09230 [Flavisolibacter sp.]|jgi:uncharacterized repeat protein (TIGR01451 family)|nr:hypothetical protein [Flavisolibacter sp.]